MKKIQSLFALLLFAFFLTFVTLSFAQEGPKTGEIWICPSVSTNNPNGVWVVGHSGAYYILKPGTASPKWPMILNPTENLEEHAAHVEHKAQHAAAWGLYKDFPTYPYFEGIAMVLPEGVHAFGLEPSEQYYISRSTNSTGIGSVLVNALTRIRWFVKTNSKTPFVCKCLEYVGKNMVKW